MKVDERAALQKELKTPNPALDMSVDDFRRIHNIALQVVRGNISSQEISELSPKLRINLDTMIEQLLMLKDKPGVRGLEKRNPYYSPFSSKIIRDN